MGRRNKRIRWSQKNDGDLLANLDFIINNILDETCRYGTTEDVLRNLEFELPEPRRTQEQIDRRLNKLWENYSTSSESWSTYEAIYRYGTQILEGLPSSLKDQVEVELGILKANQRLKAVDTPRKTRSASRNLPTESSCANDFRVASSERTPFKSQRKHRGQSPEHSPPKRIKQEPIPNKHFLRKVDPTARIPREKQFRRAARTTRSTPTKSAPILSGPPSLTITPARGNYRGTTLGEIQYPEAGSPSLLYTDKFKGKPTFDYNDANSTMRISNTKTFTQGDETLLDLFNDIEFFRGKLSNLEKMDKHMVENMRVQQGVQAKSLPGIVEERNKTIAELKQRLNDQAFAQQLLRKENGKKELPNRNRIKSSYEDMRKNIMGLSVFGDIYYYTADEISLYNYIDLTALKNRALGDSLQSPLQDDVSRSLDVWIQSLTGAAVCEWVFKESYQCIAMMNTPLLDGYRRSLSTICSMEVLQTVDSVAHQFVVDNHHFKEVFLPRTAKKLARRLLHVFDPLVKGKYSVGEEDLEQELDSIFRSALEIKTLGMTANHILELIWPSRSTIFDRNSMTEEPLGRNRDSCNDPEKVAKKVLLTLVPGLRAYSYDRQVVDYCNFTSGEEKGLDHGDLIAHALVTT
ncbi:hypothetical protein V493_00300 [Pseudogymnoascus sp. VKM F-4281 (FW-2241)]|nr:hypothetical protein V493_00300 [Pseudogymnoascus sp. VKM F-4281 (FW-2241)]